MSTKKTIGIIGGMGPWATLDLFEKILRFTDAKKDQDHIHILIDCNSDIPDRTAAIINSAPSPFPKIRDSALRLESAGADFIIIACNTSHYFINDLRAAVKAPFLSIVEETAKFIMKEGYETAILLGTDGSKKVGIYRKSLEQYNIKAIYPDETMQKEITDLIYLGIKSGKKEWDVTDLNKQIQDMESKYKNAVFVLACTELPIAQKKYGMIGNFIDPSSILAVAAIKHAGYNTTNNISFFEQA